MEIQVNYWAVVLAAIASMGIGAVWYAQSVFGKVWAKLAKVDINKKQTANQMAFLFGGTFIVALITAYVLAHVSYLSHSFFKNDFLQDVVNTAFWLWLGLTAARIFTHDSFEGRPLKLTALTVGHELVTLLVMAGIIGLFGVK